MKKRILSLLLLLALLATLLPVSTVCSGAEEGDDTVSSGGKEYTVAETFYDLYKTEGLIAFFDAFDPSNGTLDIANGKWYAKVYDEALGTFVKSETIFATLEGGAYDAETNPTGWKAGANGGFGYDDPEFASTNKLTFDKGLLSGGVGALNAPWDYWTVESIIQVNLRTIPVEIRTFTAAEDAAYKLAVVTEGDDLGSFAAKTSVVTAKWGTTKEATVVITGAAGAETAVRTVVSGTGVTAETKDHNVTIGAEGKATFKVQYKANYTDIAVFTATGVAVESISCPINTMQNAAYSNTSFLFGPLSARHWTNTLGEDYSGGGVGVCRWSVSKTPGSYGQPRVMVVAPGTSDWSDANSFITYDGKITSLVATKATSADTSEITYTVTHGDHFRRGVAKASDNYADLGLHIMNQEQGMVYAVRIYGTNDASAALTADDSKWNTSVDLLIRLGVDVAKFNKLNDELKEELLMTVLPGNAATATKEDVEAWIDAPANAKKLSIYDELYVGADGSRTANGGNLVDLFVAFGGDASVNLLSGTWINKLNDNNATFGNSKYWETRADGSVGYTGFYGQLNLDGSITKSATTNNISAGASSFTQTRLDFGIDMLPKDDYTIEYVAKYMPIYVANPDGTIAEDADGNPLEYYNANGNGVASSQFAGAVDYIGFISSWTPYRDGYYIGQGLNRGDVIWMLKDGTAFWGAECNWVGSAAWGAGGLKAPAIRENGAVHTYVMMRDESVIVDPTTSDRVVEATFSTIRDAVTYNSCTVSTANTAKGMEYFDKDDGGSFYLSSMLPTDFYSVRIYDAALTTEELKWNNFIDMASYVRADLNDFLMLDPVTQSLIVDLMADYGFLTDADAFEERFAYVVSLYQDAVTAEDSFYVTDGLRVLTAAYSTFHTGAISAVNDSQISWLNAVVLGESITMKGKGWTLRPDGGYYMIKDLTEFNKDRSFGIYLEPEMLPEDDYTVEMILNPTGIVDYQSDGTYTRHVDEETTYGYNYEHGFAIGPLRCLIYPSAAKGGSRVGLTKRWVYNYGNRCWNGLDSAGRNQIMTEDAWKSVDVHEIVPYAITLQKDADANQLIYRIYSENEMCNSASIALSEAYTNEEANNMFQLMCSQPGGVFSVRVYDRVLSEAERRQNHLADLLYFYGVDASALFSQNKNAFLRLAAITQTVEFVSDPSAREETKAYLQGLVDTALDPSRHSAVIRIAKTDIYNRDEITVSLHLTGVSISSLAVTPSFDRECFEFVAASWAVTDTVLEHIEEDSLRSVAVFADAQNLDGVVYTLTLRAKKETAATSVSFAVTVEDVFDKTALDVIPLEITIVECLHRDLCYTAMDGDAHEVSCSDCLKKLSVTAHTFDSLCDDKCDLCGYTDSLTRGHIAEAPTCTMPSICERCDELLLDALGHDLLPATCDSPIRCSRCAYKRGTPLAHELLDATCTEPIKCVNCDYTEGEALGHDMSDATCTEVSRCSRCDHIEGEALGHDMLDATCTEVSICSRCGYTVGEALGHDMLDATCTEASICSRCGYTVGEALGHDMLAATCTEASRCSRCSHTEGEALGHDMSDATCTEVSRCSRCDHTEGEALGHAWGAWQETTAPTLISDGCETRVCVRDHTHTETRTVPSPTPVAEWACGATVTARLYPDTVAGKYTLHIFGTGAMDAYTATTMPWVDYLQEIRCVKIYDGVTSIGASSLRGATSLSSVTVAPSVREIGDSAFRACESLASVSKLDNVVTVGKYAFYGCSTLPALTFGEGATLTSVGMYAFSGCDHLKRVALSNETAIAGLTDYDAYGYLLTTVETVVVPAEITSVPSYVTDVYPYTDSVMQDGALLTVYSLHSHADGAPLWENGVCTSCGIAKDSESAEMLGDVNADGVVDIADIVAVINEASGAALDPEAYPGEPDVNADGVVDIADIVAVIGIASGLSE